jgi:RNA polymerase sigma-70 factor (ECF subfamily)
MSERPPASSEGWRNVQDDLVEQAKRGDTEAFRVLVEGAADRLYSIAWRILRDPDRAEDALQQALIRIWEDLPELRDATRFDAWSSRVVVRASYREARRERRWTSRVRQIRFDALDDDCVGAVADRDALERSFRDLSPEHRAVVVLRYFNDLPVAEIARTLGIPVGTAASRLHYAVESLRASFAADARAVVALGRPA